MDDSQILAVMSTAKGTPVDLGEYTIDELSPIMPGLPDPNPDLAAAALRSLVVRGHVAITDDGIRFVGPYGLLADCLAMSDGFISLVMGNRERLTGIRVGVTATVLDRATNEALSSAFQLLDRRAAAEQLADFVLADTPVPSGDVTVAPSVTEVADDCLRFVMVNGIQRIDATHMWMDDFALVVDSEGHLWRVRPQDPEMPEVDVEPLPRDKLASLLHSLLARQAEPLMV